MTELQTVAIQTELGHSFTSTNWTAWTCWAIFGLFSYQIKSGRKSIYVEGTEMANGARYCQIFAKGKR